MKTDRQEIKREIRGVVSLRRSEGEGETKSRTITGTAIVLGAMTEIYRDDEIVIREMIAPEAVTDQLLRESDIKMTLYHDPDRLLARSKKGSGTLKWNRDDKGVYFEFDAPETPDGDTALELVSRGDIDGCSFWAWTDYDNMTTDRRTEGDLTIVERTIKGFRGIEDFTLTPSPAYEQTECDVKREKDAIMDLAEQERERRAMKESWEAIERAAYFNY